MPLSVKSAGCLILAEASGVLDTQDVERLTGAVDRRIAVRGRFLVVGDALAVEGVDAAARRFVGEHRKRQASVSGALDLGLVLAIRSPVVRGAMTAISWLGGAFANLRTVERRDQLFGVATEVLRAAGIADAEAQVALAAASPFTSR